MASCARSSWLATAASKVDRFLGLSSPYTPLCQTHGFKTWMTEVRLIVNESLKLYQLCRYQSFPDQHHHSLQAILSFLTRRHLSFFSRPKHNLKSSHHVPHVYSLKVVPTYANNSHVIITAAAVEEVQNIQSQHVQVQSASKLHSKCFQLNKCLFILLYKYII